MLLKIWVVLLTINTNLLQTIIFDFIKVELPILLKDKAVY